MLDKNERDLVDLLVRDCTSDPLLFVKRAFKWGHGELRNFSGPDEWQTSLLLDIKNSLSAGYDPINLATASGHGVGKSTVVAWLILWAMTTHEFTRGVVTANTENQLKTKTGQS